MEYAGPWSSNKSSVFPTVMREGSQCEDGTGDEPASPLLDVLRGACNPLRIPNAHRSSTCNYDREQEGVECIENEWGPPHPGDPPFDIARVRLSLSLSLFLCVCVSFFPVLH